MRFLTLRVTYYMFCFETFGLDLTWAHFILEITKHQISKAFPEAHLQSAAHIVYDHMNA